MDRSLEYAGVLAECRGCLATLADQSPRELSLIYERLLLVLDVMHADMTPAANPLDVTEDDLVARLLCGLDRLVALNSATAATQVVRVSAQEMSVVMARFSAWAPS